MGIIDEYMAQMAKEKNLLADKQREGEIETLKEEYNEDLEAKIAELRNDPNDMMNMFYREYKKVTEEELLEQNLVKDETVTPIVRRVFCPNCGKELVSKSPLLINPYTNERIAKHECECGYKANLDYAYPRICFMDKENNEVIAYSR